MDAKIGLKIVKDNLILVETSSIIYFEKEKRLIKVVLINSKADTYINMSMKNLQYILENEKLYNIHFLRPHCSYIINIEHIKIIHAKEILMSNKEKIPISESNRKIFMKQLEKNIHLI